MLTLKLDPSSYLSYFNLRYSINFSLTYFLRPFFSNAISLLVTGAAPGLESGADGPGYYEPFAASAYKGEAGLGVTLFLAIKPANNEGGYEAAGLGGVKRAERPGEGF